MFEEHAATDAAHVAITNMAGTARRQNVLAMGFLSDQRAYASAAFAMHRATPAPALLRADSAPRIWHSAWRPRHFRAMRRGWRGDDRSWYSEGGNRRFVTYLRAARRQPAAIARLAAVAMLLSASVVRSGFGVLLPWSAFIAVVVTIGYVVWRRRVPH